MPRVVGGFDTPFMGFYEGLSEHAHPNAAGLAVSYVESHKRCVTAYRDREQSRAEVSLDWRLAHSRRPFRLRS